MLDQPLQREMPISRLASQLIQRRRLGRQLDRQLGLRSTREESWRDRREAATFGRGLEALEGVGQDLLEDRPWSSVSPRS